MADLSMLINGQAVAAEKGACFERLNPLDGSVATRAPAASAADAVAAVEAAATAFKAWTSTFVASRFTRGRFSAVLNVSARVSSGTFRSRTRKSTSGRFLAFACTRLTFKSSEVSAPDCRGIASAWLMMSVRGTPSCGRRRATRLPGR